ncbi:unnamed protein product [Phytophthora fragariaefolia]|uniref:Unnamed protein product n=1 Tax=Phytophthora fragariaefolia TaxID=1490495 RepID=A0A9W7CKU0_9STRA|nr:unnamed protein product [Phytophthora fragariaefolia]
MGGTGKTVQVAIGEVPKKQYKYRSDRHGHVPIQYRGRYQLEPGDRSEVETGTALGYIWLWSPVIGALIYSDHKIGATLHHKNIFAMRPMTEKESCEEKQGVVDIASYRNHPTFPLLLKHDTMFQQKLPSSLPPRGHSEHEIEVDTNEAYSDVSGDYLLEIIDWVAEMRATGLIRPSTSPHGAPTFCVKKPWDGASCMIFVLSILTRSEGLCQCLGMMQL